MLPPRYPGGAAPVIPQGCCPRGTTGGAAPAVPQGCCPPPRGTTGGAAPAVPQGCCPPPPRGTTGKLPPRYYMGIGNTVKQQEISDSNPIVPNRVILHVILV